jgi:hypothetical protein
VRWNGASKAGLTYRIYRGAVVIAAGTASATAVAVNDTGLVRDTTYCYVAEVDEPSYGPNRSTASCGYTSAGQSVIRLQMQLTTGTVSDANTNSSIFVDIAGRRTWLDHNRDDFERGDTHTYDLTLVGDTSDIRSLTLGKTGSDGWCIKEFKLLVNGGSMFEQSFANQPGGCHWLDNEGGAVLRHSVTHATLRAHPNWATYRPPLPELPLTQTATGYRGSFVISGVDLRERIEGMVGNAIHGTALYWSESGAAVDVAPHPTLTNGVHVTVHVKGSGFGPNATITIDFDLLFGLSQRGTGHAVLSGGPIAVSITDENFDVHSTGSWDDDGAEADVRNGWPGVDIGFLVDVDAVLQPFASQFPELAPYLGRCCDALTVAVDGDANVRLSADLSPRPPRPWDGLVFPGVLLQRVAP